MIAEPPLAWWDIAARAGDAAQGALNHASQRPRLVSLKLKDDDEYLRPMLLVLDFGDELILYDFLADDVPADGRIYPIRTVKAADVAAVVSSYTYDDPHTKQTDPSTGEPIEVGQIGTVSAARGLIRAVCGKAGLDLPVVEVALAPSTWLEEFKYVTQYHVDGDHISCGDVPEEAAKPVVFELGDRTVATLDTTALRLAELASGYVKAAADSATAMQALTKGYVQAAANSSAAVKAVADAIANWKGPDAQPPPTASPNPAPIYILNLVNCDGNGAVPGDKWALCEPALADWDKADFSIQFQNGKWRLDGPTRNDLDAGETAERAWETLKAVFEDWADQIISIRALGPKEGDVFLFLVGRASENGRVDANLLLTERRAAAVKRALVDLARPRNWDLTGLDDAHVIAVGEGETGLAPFEDTSSPTTRRVDARLCFVSLKRDEVAAASDED